MIKKREESDFPRLGLVKAGDLVSFILRRRGIDIEKDPPAERIASDLEQTREQVSQLNFDFMNPDPKKPR